MRLKFSNNLWIYYSTQVFQNWFNWVIYPKNIYLAFFLKMIIKLGF